MKEKMYIDIEKIEKILFNEDEERKLFVKQMVALMNDAYNEGYQDGVGTKQAS